MPPYPSCKPRVVGARHLVGILLATAALAWPLIGRAQQFQDESFTRLPFFSEYSSQVAIADIDGDGDLDLAYANGSGYGGPQQQQTLRIFINDGTGYFTDESAARTGGLVGYGRDVEFGDVDGDGDLDMMVGNDFYTPPHLLINDGNGFFTDESLTRLPAISLSCSHIGFGDVDNDGDLDVWLTNGGGSSRFGSGQAQLWINDGDGFFTDETATRLPVALVSEPMDCIFGDVDGDFDLDMVEGHRASNSRLYINDGTGVFTNATSGNLPPDSSTYSYDFGDLDGDGDLDLLGVNSLPGSSQEALFVNNGSGMFSNLTGTLLPGANNPNVDDNDSKFFDYDDDGDLDFIIASLGSTERICNNDGTGHFTLTTGVITAVADSSLDVEVGDLDGNGSLDIVTAQGESGNFANRLYINTGPADTHPPTFPQLEALADTTDTTGPYAVRVKIRDGMTSDHNCFLSDAVLSYSVDAGPATTVDLRWMGGDVYRATIPGQAAGSTITYHAEATDFAGNASSSTDATFHIAAQFDRGDCNADGTFDISDAISLLSSLFLPGGTPLACEDACDGNDDGALDIADPIAILNALFPSGPPPVIPAPHGSCGVDPTLDSLDCQMGNCP